MMAVKGASACLGADDVDGFISAQEVALTAKKIIVHSRHFIVRKFTVSCYAHSELNHFKF